MPIYRYECKSCKQDFEFLKLNSSDHVQCPKCQAKGEENFEKLIANSVSHQLKGGGWYKDGYSGKRRK